MSFYRSYGSDHGGYGYNSDQLASVYDYLPAPESLWSVARRLRRAYTGPVIRVRRSSDNVEQDFYGSGASGIVSPEAIRSFNGWNLLARTEDFGNAYWTTEQCNVSTNVATWRGQLVADRVTVTSDNLIHRIRETTNRSFVAGQQVTYSLFVKYDNAQYVNLVIGGVTDDPVTANRRAVFDIVNGTIITNTTYAATAFIVPDGDGWYRIGFTMQGPSATVQNRCGLIILNASQQEVYAGNGESVLIAGAQLEIGTARSTYEPRTTTGAGSSFLVTRYDQSGNARHATQATTTLQPIVCESGVPVVNSGGRLTGRFVAATGHRLIVNSSTSIYNFLHTTGGTVLAVVTASDTAADKTILGNKPNSTDAGIHITRETAERLSANAGRLDVAGVATAGRSVTWSAPVGTGTTAASIAIVQLDPDNGTAANRLLAWQDGSVLNATNADTGTPFVENATTNLTIGSRNTASNVPFDGTIGDIGIWEGFLTEAQRKLVEADQGRFNSITVAP